MGKTRLTLTGVGADAKVFDLVGELVVGRSAKVEVQIDGDLGSRQHARFYEEDGHWYVEDLGSRNGTLVNGTRVTTSGPSTPRCGTPSRDRPNSRGPSPWASSIASSKITVVRGEKQCEYCPSDVRLRKVLKKRP